MSVPKVRNNKIFIFKNISWSYRGVLPKFPWNSGYNKYEVTK